MGKTRILGLGIDVCPVALRQAQANARRLFLNCDFSLGTFAEHGENVWGLGSSDTTSESDGDVVIIANPPYLSEADFKGSVRAERRSVEPSKAFVFDPSLTVKKEPEKLLLEPLCAETAGGGGSGGIQSLEGEGTAAKTEEKKPTCGPLGAYRQIFLGAKTAGEKAVKAIILEVPKQHQISVGKIAQEEGFIGGGLEWTAEFTNDKFGLGRVLALVRR